MRTKILLLLIIILSGVLRMVALDSVPPSLYWDEASQAYNAKSILLTGRDEHQEFLPIARFIAFGDYKAPTNIYLMVPSIAFFGLNEFAIRFPSAFLGTLTVLLTFLLCMEIFKNDKKKDIIALSSAFLLGISPWHIQLSRAAYEANIATFFTVAGVYTFFLAKNKNPWLYLISAVSFIVGFYSFNAHRVFIPLLLIFMTIIYWSEIRKSLFKVLLASLLGFILLVPFLLFLKTPESKLRFREVNIFTDVNIVREANKRQDMAGNTTISKIIDNRRVLFAESYLKHYLDFFNPNYLFFTGDENPRFSLQDNGILYIWELPLLISGVITLIKKRNKEAIFILGWFLLAPIGNATARETPHALRALTYIPTYQIFGGLGIVYLVAYLKSLKNRFIFPIFSVSYTVIVVFTVMLFIHNYFVHFPTRYPYAWQYGYKQVIAKVVKIENNYDEIRFTTFYGRPYVYVLLYGNISPEEFWKKGEVVKDPFGFYNVYSIGKYKFSDNFKGKPNPKKKILYVGTPEQIGKKMKVLDEVIFPSGEKAYVIAESI